MDTFAYRQPNWANSLNIVEADHPASQANKISTLKNAGIPIPTNLSFVEVDLEHDNLTSIFAASSLDLTEPIFISCLGVLVYLSQTTIYKLFRFVGQLAPISEFVFTISNRRDNEILSRTAERAAEAGEPWLTHFSEDELRQQLVQVGFSAVIFETPESITAKYFEGSKLQLPAPKRNTLVRAIR